MQTAAARPDRHEVSSAKCGRNRSRSRRPDRPGHTLSHMSTRDGRRHRHPRLDPRHDRRHAAGAPLAHRRRADAPDRRQARALQPRRLDQGPRRDPPDRGGGAGRAPEARRHDHRADLGQHRHRPGDRRAPEGLPRDRGDAGQDVEGEDRPAARLRRRGRGGADRRRARLAAVLLPRRRPPHARRSPAPSSPTSTPTRPTRRRTTRRPGRSCGARPAAASRTWSSASAPAARSPGWRAT